MTTYFKNAKIDKVIVEGNGESLYFALDEKTNASMGMNKILCSKITIRFLNGKIDNLSFYTKPDANFIPPHELKPEDVTLKGFSWMEKEKPTRNDVVKKQILPDLPEKGERKRL